MEEKLKAPDSQSGDSEVRLFQRCQELQALVQEKEDVIAQLGQQLEEQVKRIKATDVVQNNKEEDVAFTHMEAHYKQHRLSQLWS